MRNVYRLLIAVLAPVLLGTAAYSQPAAGHAPALIQLPAPELDGSVSLERALASRRSARTYATEPLSLADVAQLLWAAQGVTGSSARFRTAPSAGALCPLEVYVVAANVGGLEPGVYRYRPVEHALELAVAGDRRSLVSTAALGQKAPAAAPAVFAIAAVYSRTSGKYGERAERYVPMDAGHSAENLLLQATARGLDCVPMGAFDDAELQAALGLPAEEEPLYLIPVGHPAP
ncbi:SagB/ThcOx family dehydrogenase [bacterium]|nr:SagB/ThcOx family dehydrogenase [bacterium]